jgi:hypothetical protein
LFLTTNDRLVNLQNVSNINVIRDRNRIVFNLNYNIEIKKDYKGKVKFISDYVYWDAKTDEELNQFIDIIIGQDYFKGNFIDQIDGNGFININEISSIKFSDRKYRVIFNLSHPITFKDFDGNERITSEFVYVNCKDSTQYNEYVKYVKQTLGEK